MTDFKWKRIPFDLTEDHVKLLRDACISWETSAYEGAPSFDNKRPFGNSDVVSDIAEIIGLSRVETDDGLAWPAGTRDRCMALYRELETALQVVLAAGSFEPGRYECDEYHRNWERVQ